jgi:hypothetical protein
LAPDPKDGTFRVIDRRLFNEQGELRKEVVEEIEAEEKTKPATGPAKANAPTGSATPAAAKAPAPDTPAVLPEPPKANPNFRLLVDFLVQNAAFYMGNPDPRTGQSLLDLEGARFMIDLVDVLREKTKGNLAPEEDQMLVDITGKLKLAFMDVSKAAAATMREKAGHKA